MSIIDQIIADALAGSPETHVAILAREVVRLREAPAVVVPELTEVMLSLACGCAIEPTMGQDAIKYGLRTAKREGYRAGWNGLASRLRAIPADRVPGEGMVAVDRDEIDLLRLLRDRAIDTAPAGELRGIAKDALRANQGGAAT